MKSTDIKVYCKIITSIELSVVCPQHEEYRHITTVHGRNNSKKKTNLTTRARWKRIKFTGWKNFSLCSQKSKIY